VTDSLVVVFQDCVSLPEVVPVPYIEQCHYGNQFIHINVEEIADIQEEEQEVEAEDPLALTFPVVNTEHEVSFMSVCQLLGTFYRWLDPFVLILFQTCHSQESAPLLCEILKSLFENVSRF
jgi:hypothetical protein